MHRFRTEATAGMWPRLAGRLVLSLGLGAGFLWLLAARLAEVNPSAVGAAMSQVVLLQWGLALMATVVSFWAVGQYDVVMHRYFRTGVTDAVARRAGICAISVSQMLGLGVITGSVLRWRMLPGQSAGMATRLTVAVAGSFLAGWGVVTAAVLLVLPDAPFRGVAAGMICCAGLTLVAVAVSPRLTRAWPNLFTMGNLVGLAAVDTIAAALALYCLLPADLGLALTTLLPAFLIAQGAGLLSGAPGGVGAFEVTLLALLPSVPQDPLLAAVLAWRLIYYALPAMLGGLRAAFGTAETPSVPKTPHPPLPRAEAGIAAQGEHIRLDCGNWLVGRTPHVLVGLFDPLDRKGHLDRLIAAAGRDSRWPAVYKCTGRTAVRTRRAGWRVAAIAREAWLDPRHFRLDHPDRAGLRRKLRRAGTAGLHTSTGGSGSLPEMTSIAAQWAAAHGGERGFSMGRYSPAYVATQRVYLAHRAGRLVAFATFHAAPQEWALDLMRYGPDMPDGTMQALVAAAIADCADAGVSRLSLAAVPEPAFGGRRRVDRLWHRAGRDNTGLLQFKASFAPRWQRLYLAAPHPLALAVAAAEIARSIATPPPLRQIEQSHAEYEFASAPRPWQEPRTFHIPDPRFPCPMTPCPDCCRPAIG